ncbi:hypothetical protein ANO11243_079600 [Dothideomycetidae sp. 11243]|nr:hypothetical protein ANO11243_079600 [fungal sp. No.11243]
MRSALVLTSFLSLATSGFAALQNTTREFKLVSEVIPGQAADLARFNGLEVTGYHSGAGLNDAVLLPSPNGGKAFFNVTNPVVKRPNGEPYYNLIFDLGGDYPWAPQILDVDFYAEWLPVAINIGNLTSGGAWFAEPEHGGVQFSYGPGQTGQNEFGGWLVCDWFRGVPQLFTKLSYYNSTNPSSCASVYLRRHFL